GLDAAALALYPDIVGAPPGDEPAAMLSITKLLLDGFAGVGAMSMPGYDYHTNDRSTGEIQDVRCGKIIGYALEMAARKNKDLFVYASTDGAQNSFLETVDDSEDGRGKLAWNTDSGTHGASFILVHRSGSAGRPRLRKTGRQYGSWVEGGGVDTAGSPVAT